MATKLDINKFANHAYESMANKIFEDMNKRMKSGDTLELKVEGKEILEAVKKLFSNHYYKTSIKDGKTFITKS